MRTLVIPRTVFEFTQTTAGAATAVVPLATRIDASQCVSGSIYLRLHSKSWTSSTGSFTVSAKNVSYTNDEPDVAYAESGTPVASIAVATADAAPKLYVEALATPIADQLQIVLEWTHGADTTTKTFAISVELELRDS